MPVRNAQGRVPKGGAPRKVRRKRPYTLPRTHKPANAQPAPKRTTAARPAPKRQPGPFTDKERRKVRRFKKTPEYRADRRAAKRAGRNRALALWLSRRNVARPKGVKVGPATITPTGVAREIARTTNPLGLASRIPGPVGDLPRNAVKDAFDIPANAVPSAIHTGRALGKAALGDSKEAEELWEQAKKTDPLLLTAQGKLKEAGKAAYEHPLVAALEVSGAKAVVGRGTGAAARRAPSKTLRKAGSTKRAPRKLEGTKIEQRRAYSKDLITKGRQVAQEKRARKKASRLRREADEAEARGHVDVAKQKRDRAVRKDPDRIGPESKGVAEVRRRTDERVQANEDVRRIHRTKITAKARKATAKRAGPVQPLVAQNIVRDRADLRAYLSELEAEFPALTDAGKLANRKLREDIREALKRDDIDFAAVREKAAEYRDLIAPLERELDRAGVLPRAQAERSKLIPYAVRKMGAKHDGDRLMLNGRKLSNREIRAHMKEHGFPEPAFITQAPNMRGARNFYQGSGERPRSLQSKPRTGEATRRGTFDADPETLTEGAARLQGLVDTNKGFKDFADEFARRDGRKVKTYKTRAEAQAAVNELEARGGSVGWRPIRLNPFAGKRDQLEALLRDVDADNQPEARQLVEAMQDAVKPDAEGPGPWALVPEAAADQLLKHLRVQGAGGAGKVAQMVNSFFRKAVLSTSESWATGNVLEAGFRSALMGAGPRSYLTGRKTLKRLERLDPDAAEQAAVRIVGGGHYSLADRGHIRRSAEQFYGTRLEPTARALGAFWRVPGPKHAAGAWRAWTEFVFPAMRRVESQFQTAMLGKHLRDDMDTFVKVGGRAVDDAAAGLRNTNAQVRFGRLVDRAYGKYSKWGPTERKMIVLYTPFIAWWLNAVKFVFDVLPRDHPVVTSLLATSHQATEEWRNEHGLGQFIDGRVPGWLQGSLPLKGGGHQRAPNRYLPFGAFQDPLAGFAGSVLPQYRGTSQMLVYGQDWKGKKLYKDGQELDQIDKAVYGAHEFLKATVPLLGQVERVAGGEGPLGARLGDEFNPVKPVSPPKKKGADPLAAPSSGSNDPLAAPSSSNSDPLR